MVLSCSSQYILIWFSLSYEYLFHLRLSPLPYSMHSFKHSPGPNFIAANSSLASHPKPHPLCPLHHRHFGSFLHFDLFSAVWWFWHGNATVSPNESLPLNRAHQVSAVTEARRGEESTGMPLTSLNRNWDSFFFFHMRFGSCSVFPLFLSVAWSLKTLHTIINVMTERCDWVSGLEKRH